MVRSRTACTPQPWLISTLPISVNVLLSPKMIPGLLHSRQLLSEYLLLQMILVQVSRSLKKQVKQNKPINAVFWLSFLLKHIACVSSQLLGHEPHTPLWNYDLSRQHTHLAIVLVNSQRLINIHQNAHLSWKDWRHVPKHDTLSLCKVLFLCSFLFPFICLFILQTLMECFLWTCYLAWSRITVMNRTNWSLFSWTLYYKQGLRQ